MTYARLATILATLATAVAFAQDATSPRVADPTTGLVALFPGPLQEIVDARGASRAPGWHIAGLHYISGAGWWTMSCERQACTLAKAQLTVSYLEHPDYDGPMLPGQHLVWSPVQRGTLVMMFKPLRELAEMPLKEGPVKTWLHAGMALYPRPDSQGTMETLIPLEDEPATIVPRLRAAQPSPVLFKDKEYEGGELTLELRAYGLRQTLGTYEWDIEGPRGLSGRDYLQWAGDLDGDGKLDVIVSFRGRGWDSVLFLSSLAKPGQIVGEAGRFRYSPPNDPGC